MQEKEYFQGDFFFLPLGTSFREDERWTIYNLSSQLRNPEKGEQFKSKAGRRKEIRRMKAEINELGKRKSTEKINGSRSRLFKKVNKIKVQARLHGHSAPIINLMYVYMPCIC